MSELILASQSPYRKQLLTQLGYKFSCQNPNIDERQLEKNHDGPLNSLPLDLACAKAESIANKNPQAIVIGSDQLLIFKGQTFHKPSTKDEAIERLQQLQGQTHELHTSLCVIKNQEKQTSTCVANMTMRSLTLKEIQHYVDQDNPVGCAGAYKIELKGSLLFEKIETTDHSSIIGLPVLSLVTCLKQWKVFPL